MPTPFLCALASVLALAAPQDGPIRILDHQSHQIALQRIVNEHPEIASVLTVGVSREGRRIDALRLSAGARRPGRPGLLLIAGLEGEQTFSSALALDHARQLCSAYGEDDRVTTLLDQTNVYILPRANPDALEDRFDTPLRVPAGTGTGVDNDRDGRSGEDDLRDLDGDGWISWMRKRDPEGTWIVDPTDARAMREADPMKGEVGEWLLMPEAEDQDGDERFGEDAPRDAHVNRNFPAWFEEHTPRAGRFATDEPEARAVVDFLLAHPDIGVALVYGDQSNVAEKPKTIADDKAATKRIPARGLREGDGKYVAVLGENYRDLVSHPAAGSSDDAGSFQLWAYEHFGLMTINVRPWAIPLDAKRTGEAADEDEEEEKDAPKPSDDAKRLLWLDQNGETAQRFSEWSDFKHPQLGDVQIGGFLPYSDVEPPSSETRRIADEHYAFLLELGQKLPRLRFEKVEAKPLGAGLVRVHATLRNDGFLPYRTTAARLAGMRKPALVRLELPPRVLLLGGSPVARVEDLAGAGGRAEFEWLVGGAAYNAIKARFDSEHAGAAEGVVPELKR